MSKLPKLRMRSWTTLVVLVILASLVAVISWSSMQSTKRTDYESMRGWQSISGRWNMHGGTFFNSNYGRGDMLIAQHSQGKDYSIAADIRFDLLFPESHYGDAGLVIRTSDPEQGVDSYEGYYAGLRPDDQSVILGRASYNWQLLARAPLTTPVKVGAWYRVQVAVRGCTLTVTVTPQDDGSPTRLEHKDDNCLTQGVAGLRSFYAQAAWRNVQITGL